MLPINGSIFLAVDKAPYKDENAVSIELTAFFFFNIILIHIICGFYELAVFIIGSRHSACNSARKLIVE